MTGRDATSAPVAVGDRLGPIEIGETTLTQMVRWAGAADDYSAIHFDPRAAAERGLSGAVVTGPWKAAVLTRMVTEWLGDRGRLARISCQYRRSDLVGCALSCAGVVTAVRHNAGQGLAELELRVSDEHGRATVTAKATVELRVDTP